MYKVQLVGASKETIINNETYTIQAGQLFQNIEKTNLIIVPMICGNFPYAIEANKEFIPWIIKQYKNNAEIACLCFGSFFLASTGLLNGKTCAVHWGASNDFSKMFPEVKVVNDKIITYGQGIYTSGGYFSYLNLILCLIEKYSGREMSVLVSKMFEIDIERKSHALFMIFMGQKDHEDEPCEKSTGIYRKQLSR